MLPFRQSVTSIFCKCFAGLNEKTTDSSDLEGFTNEDEEEDEKVIEKVFQWWIDFLLNVFIPRCRKMMFCILYVTKKNNVNNKKK
jgi:hypothetical protein